MFGKSSGKETRDVDPKEYEGIADRLDGGEKVAMVVRQSGVRPPRRRDIFTKTALSGAGTTIPAATRNIRAMTCVEPHAVYRTSGGCKSP